MLPDECRAPASEDGPEGWQQDARKSEDCDFNPESPQRGADDHDPSSIVGVWSKDEGMKVEARIVRTKFESRAILALGDATCFFSISWAREFPGHELFQLSGIRYRAFYHGDSRTCRSFCAARPRLWRCCLQASASFHVSRFRRDPFTALRLTCVCCVVAGNRQSPTSPTNSLSPSVLKNEFLRAEIHKTPN